MTTEAEWESVWLAVQELAGEYGDDIVVIGGVGVYLHALRSKSLPVEFTHDVDLSVGLPSWGDMREQYGVVVNRRLGKGQLTIGDVEVDLYPERNNELRVDFAELAMASVVIDDVRVASLEHLLLLKLDAFADRGRSAHGEKDRRDIAKLLVLLEKTKPDLTLSMGTDADVALLEKVLKSSAFTELAGRNAQTASRLRRRATEFVTRLVKAMGFS